MENFNDSKVAIEIAKILDEKGPRCAVLKVRLTVTS